MDLGITIKKLRKQKNIPQGEFASICGISQTYLSQIESNHKEPQLSLLKTISEKLEMPLPILFFLSLSIDDVQDHKRNAFELISPAVKSLINEFFKI